jgi:hypothetical protein
VLQKSLRSFRTKNLEAHSGAPEHKTWRLHPCAPEQKNLEAHSGAPEQKTWRLTWVFKSSTIRANVEIKLVPLLSKTVIFVHDEYRLLITLLEHMNEPPG